MKISCAWKNTAPARNAEYNEIAQKQQKKKRERIISVRTGFRVNKNVMLFEGSQEIRQRTAEFRLCNHTHSVMVDCKPSVVITFARHSIDSQHRFVIDRKMFAVLRKATYKQHICKYARLWSVTLHKVSYITVLFCSVGKCSWNDLFVDWVKHGKKSCISINTEFSIDMKK